MLPAGWWEWGGAAPTGTLQAEQLMNLVATASHANVAMPQNSLAWRHRMRSPQVCHDE